MTKPVIHIGNVRSKIVADKKTIKLLTDYLKVENDFWARKATEFRMPKYKSYITPKGRFNTGLLNRVARVLKFHDVEYDIEDHREKIPVPPVEQIKSALKLSKYKPRPYQLEAIITGLENPFGIIKSATGTGKSVMMGFLLIAWNLKSIILVKDIGLARQLREEFAKILGVRTNEIGFIGGGEFNQKRVTIGMVQSINSRSAKKLAKIKDYLKTVEAVFVDECHNAQANNYQNALTWLENAYVRLSFTATNETSLFKTEEDGKNQDDLLLEAWLGPVIFDLPLIEMIEEGYLCKPEVYFVENELYFDGNPLDYVNEYERIIVNDEERNRVACKVAHHCFKNGGNVVLFIDRLAHGENIIEMLVNEFRIPPDKIAYVHGDDTRLSKEKRRSLLADFKAFKIPIIIGTVLNEGIDFNCDAAVNLAGGESPRKTIQRLGRILRKMKDENGKIDLESDEIAVLFDFKDIGHVFFQPHGESRRKTFEKERRGHPDGEELIKIKSLTMEEFDDYLTR
ncbi:MAG: hypothetical protein CL489_16500 [Acidobacteria bacterium]|nr:hypothetical protein [Acidobacteriota bacterium]|tara:strand:+ start:12135 stop:13667 length:1533 start_codon:yes stop_codon:yes gene_type:complete